MSDPIAEAALLQGRLLVEKAAPGMDPVAMDAVWRDIARGVTYLCSARVSGCHFTLVDGQPIPRVILRLGKKKYVLDPGRLLESAVARTSDRLPSLWAGSSLVEAAAPAFKLILASVSADVSNAVVAALSDEAVVGPIKEKLAKRRAKATARALTEIRESFKGKVGVLTREDVLQAWDEAVCAAVMES